MTRRLVVALLGAVTVALAACSSSGGGSTTSSSPSELNGRVSQTGGAFQGFGIDPPLPRPSFTLTDTSGKPYSFAKETAGRPTLLFFGYTNCPDVCPTTMADAAQALTQVPEEVRKQTVVVFVSTDVKRDTGPVIAKWLANFDTGNDARFVGLRGTQAQIDAAQTASHVAVAEDGGQTHSAQVLLYGVDDYARVQFLQSTSEAAQIAHDLPLVASKG